MLRAWVMGVTLVKSIQRMKFLKNLFFQIGNPGNM